MREGFVYLEGGSIFAEFHLRDALGKGDAGQFAFEVFGIALAIAGMVQQGVDVMEDVLFANRFVGVVLLELGHGGVVEMREREALPLSSAD
jgi:hypothetical protein